MMRTGFSKPIIISDGKPVGLKVPDKDYFDNFTVKDIEKLVSKYICYIYIAFGTWRLPVHHCEITELRSAR